MPRRRADNLLWILFDHNEFWMLKYKRLRRLGGCRRFARCKGCRAEALNVRDLYRKRHEKPFRGAESLKLKAESKYKTASRSWKLKAESWKQIQNRFAELKAKSWKLKAKDKFNHKTHEKTRKRFACWWLMAYGLWIYEFALVFSL